MLIKAEANNLKVSPRKLLLVADLIRPLKPQAALMVLANLDKRAASLLAKVIKQAIANAVNNLNLPKNSLQFHSIEVYQGPIFKRLRQVARGRGHGILKRTSHIKIILSSSHSSTLASPKKSVKITPSKKLNSKK